MIGNHRGIDFSCEQPDADKPIWRWEFKVGNKMRRGLTETKLAGMAIRRVQCKINSELRKKQNVDA